MNWIIGLVAAGLLVNGLRLRRRVTGLGVLPPARAVHLMDGHTPILAQDADVPDHVLRTAADHARGNGLGMLDLVPADLPVQQALDLVRHVDPRAYRKDRFGLGRGAGYAVLLEDDALERSRTETTTGLDAGEMGEATTRLRFYVDAADMAVAPFPATDRIGQRRAWLRSQALALPSSLALPQTSYLTGAGYLLALSGLLIDLRLGLGLVALYSLMPYLIFVGTPIKPADLHSAAWLRIVHTPLTIWRTLCAARTRWERALLARREEARAGYRADIEAGVERFLGERREDCPWCGARDLAPHLVTRDTIQVKPGRFPLERCRRCRHIFQNPQLTIEGLDFYYRDAYDGLGDQAAERILSGTSGDYIDRARLVERFTTPRAWLDVGTGKGHFCRSARTVFPDTEFDGLDMGDGVEEAARRGWIGRSFRRSFLDVGAEMAGRYDVVSMNHYLEHTLDPHAELDMAAKMLDPGGYLLMEMPDPESPFATLLRGLYLPYLPPQHLHMIPLGNLREALSTRGFEVVAVQRREARRGLDITPAAASIVSLMGIDVERPWNGARPPGPARYLRANAALLLAVPIVGVGVLLDLLSLPFLRGDRSNTYRLLARKQPA
ncbi:class I SAM-dependent methyltransferase [Thermomonospora umbrina]|uniref:class I SAM-dependent methyltransferase n=1 Tax=Thermomonospora umbrina TaxID=111806 RepID=UPI000E22CEF8|nr:class I SAM-dependent methyltransferase [Thermomonospora umbrina]